jgi:hypothetical protein
LGANFQLKYPLSWQSKEGDRPEILRQFVSENGRGRESISLFVSEIPPAYVPNSKDLDEMFSEEGIKVMVEAMQPGAKIISAKPIVLDLRKSGMFVMDFTIQQLEHVVKMRSLGFLTVVGNKSINLIGYVSAQPNKEGELAERYMKFEPLFKLVANSFVVVE